MDNTARWMNIFLYASEIRLGFKPIKQYFHWIISDYDIAKENEGAKLYRKIQLLYFRMVNGRKINVAKNSTIMEFIVIHILLYPLGTKPA